MHESTKAVVTQVATATLYVAMIVMNAVTGASVGVFKGRGPGDISDDNPTRITPAGSAFSIWSVIFLSLLWWTVNLCLPSQRKEYADSDLKRVGGWMALNFTANALWVVVFAFQQWVLSIILMLVILATLLLTYQRLGIGQHSGDVSDSLIPSTTWSRFALVDFPISLYLGWISVATIVNFAVFFKAVGWRSGEDAWTIVMLSVATALAVAMVVRRSDFVYAAVVCWATAWIAVAQAAHPTVHGVAVAASVLSGVAAAAGAWNKAQAIAVVQRHGYSKSDGVV